MVDVHGDQPNQQRGFVELRFVVRARHRVHIHQLRDTLAGEQFEERFGLPG